MNLVNDPGIIVFDLDSTLADTRPRREHCPTVDLSKTWTDYERACANDRPMPGTVALLRLLWDSGHEIHIVTWRSLQVSHYTLAWLDQHNIPYDLLRMRWHSDPKDSNEYKTYVINRMIQIGKTPKLVVEDWPEAAAAIETLGIPVLTVDPRYRHEPAPTP